MACRRHSLVNASLVVGECAPSMALLGLRLSGLAFTPCNQVLRVILGEHRAKNVSKHTQPARNLSNSMCRCQENLQEPIQHAPVCQRF